MSRAVHRAVAWLLAAAWIVIAGHALVLHLLALGRALPAAFAPPSERQALQSGDAPYQEFLVRTGATAGGAPRLLVMAFDPNRNDLFQFYRAAYVLFPQRVWYVPVSDLSGMRKRFTIHVGPEISAMVRDHAVAHAAYYHRPDPSRSRWWTVRSGRGDELLLEDLTAPLPAAPPPPVSGGLWLLGILSLLLAGWAMSAAVGLDDAVRDDPGARLGLGFVVGVGGTAWLMEILTFAHVAWRPAVIWACWLPVALVGAWRLTRPRTAVAEPADQPVASASTWEAHVTRLGPYLFGTAVLLPVIQALVPVSAWSNWDAWAVWALKAKAGLEARGIPFGFLQESQYTFAHPDYPPGIPAVQTYLELLAGGANEHLLRVLSVAYAAALAAIVAAALRDLGASSVRWAVAGALVLTPKMLEFSSIGYLDLPTACHMTACGFLLVRVWQGRAPAWLVGVLGGLAGLVKDEGLIWGAGCLAVLGVWTLRRRVGWRQVAAATLVLGALAGPWKLAAHRLGFKPNDYVVDPARMIGRMPERVPLVLAAVVHESLGAGATMPALAGRTEFDPGQVYDHLLASWGFLWFAGLAALAMGWRGLMRSPWRELTLPLLLQAAAYTGVILASKWDVSFHLVTTMDRLLLELAPAVVLLAAGAWVEGTPAVPAEAPPRATGGRRART